MRRQIESNEQREGRILRQGNQNGQIGIYRYVVERSFDAYSWQTVERKAKFIAQVTRGRLDVRQIDDIGESTLSYTEVKALASGDPLLLEHASAANELTKLQRQRRAWERNRQLLHDTAVSAAAREQARGTDIEQVDAALKLRTDTRAERFAMTIGATRYADRRAAADALSRWAKDATLNQARPLGELGALKLTGVVRLDYQHGGREAHVTLDGVPVDPAHATCTRTHSGSCASSSTASKTSTAYAASCSPNSRKQPKKASGREKRSPNRSSTPRPWLPQSASTSRSNSR